MTQHTGDVRVVEFFEAGNFDRYVTVGRTWRDRRLRLVQTVKKVKFEPKITIFKDRTYGSHLWWTRCDHCWIHYAPESHALSETHVKATQKAVLHAWNVHQVYI